ncbi:unnamed protein product [Alopecurus aequalis]
MAAPLPDEIMVWEILVRLPPKALLRCRAVCAAWRRATSARRFLLVHHAHQPNLPLLQNHGSDFLDIIPFDHRAGLTTADQLQPAARLRRNVYLLDSCDGILILRHRGRYAVCNPATRQFATLQQTVGFTALGFYLHHSTDEYRLLLYRDRVVDVPGLPYHMDAKLPLGVQDGCHVLTLGSHLPPRHIGWPKARELVYDTNVLLRGSLHWYPRQRPESGQKGVITVFDTTNESFRQMHAPLLPPGSHDRLFQMHGMLAIACSNDAHTIVAIWVLQEYESEVWTFRCQVRLPVKEIRARFCMAPTIWTVRVISSYDDDAVILIWFRQRLLHVDLDGKLVANFHCKGLCNYSHRLKQSLVLHTFFPALEGYVVNNSPFISTSD